MMHSFQMMYNTMGSKVDGLAVREHYPGLEKTSRISEFSGGRLFEKIEWGPPLKTEKLLLVMKKTEKARIEWGGSHSILATGARRNPELRGGCHSILSKRRPLRGGSQFPFYLVKKAALEGRLPFYPGYRRNPEFMGSAFLPG